MFLLPRTDAPVPVHFGSGTRKVTLLRPPETYAALRAEKGLTSLSLDGEWIGTLASADWRSAGPEDANGGYDITLAAGSNHLTIDLAGRADGPTGPGSSPDRTPA